MRRSSLNAESHGPWSHTAARGLVAFARNASTARTLCQRFMASSTGQRQRDSAMIVWAERTTGASVVHPKPQPANNRLSARGGPFVCPCRPVCRARWACSAFKR
jgi:hypothetical protein